VLHADDWLFPSCLAEMVGLAELHPSVSIVGAYRLDDTRITLDGLPFPSTVTAGRDVCRRTLRGELYVFGTPTSLLIRSDRVRSAQLYDEALFPLHWDTAACYELLSDADFGFVHQVLTFTRRSASGRASFSRSMNTYAVETLRMLQRYGPRFFDPAEYQRSLDERLISYLEFLGRSILYPHEKAFWEYHKTALAELGYSYPRATILQAALRAAAEVVIDPVRRLLKAYQIP
jgi:hypothetical protein